jgi:hypothetical protein
MIASAHSVESLSNLFHNEVQGFRDLPRIETTWTADANGEGIQMMEATNTSQLQVVRDAKSARTYEYQARRPLTRATDDVMRANLSDEGRKNSNENHE